MKLSNLNQIGESLKKRYLAKYRDVEIEMTDAFKDAYRNAVKERFSIVFQKYSATLTVKTTDLKIFLPNQWFSMAAFMCEYHIKLIEYKNTLEEIACLNKDNITNKEFWELIVKQKGKESIDEPLKTWLAEAFHDDIESLEYMKCFLTDFKWWSGGKSVDRHDYYISPVLQLLGVVNATQTFISDISYTYAITPNLLENAKLLVDRIEENANDDMKLAKLDLFAGENIIYYGAPGTGKSHNLEKKSKEFNSVERVTFYPEYTHDDFIGCFMPCMSYVKDDTSKYVAADGTIITLPGKPVPYYTYVAGPFTNALVDAFNNPDKNVLLIVEELNRANAAAVFGEFFQLLDRCEEDNKEGRKEGESKYNISVSNEYSEYLSSKIATYSKGEKVTIPSNFTICATMNSADQGVNPLDSAFKRRWNFIYVPIDFSDAEHKDYEIEYGESKVTWETFATTINNQLKKKDINEDKHLGQFFITKTEIADLYKFASKILLYLFDDVLKFNRRGFFKNDYKTFSDLLEGFINGEKIFEFEFNSEISRGTERETNSELALDAQNVAEGSEVNYAEQPENDDMPRVAEDGSNGFQDKVL